MTVPGTDWDLSVCLYALENTFLHRQFYRNLSQQSVLNVMSGCELLL